MAGAAKVQNPHRISVVEFLENEGYESVGEYVGEYVGENMDMLMDSVVPALCDEGCEVEPDGRCLHGCPSILIALGVI